MILWLAINHSAARDHAMCRAKHNEFQKHTALIFKPSIARNRELCATSSACLYVVHSMLCCIHSWLAVWCTSPMLAYVWQRTHRFQRLYKGGGQQHVRHVAWHLCIGLYTAQRINTLGVYKECYVLLVLGVERIQWLLNSPVSAAMRMPSLSVCD